MPIEIISSSCDPAMERNLALPISIAENQASSDFPFLLNGPQGIFISWNSKKEGYQLIPITPAAFSTDR